MRVTVLIVESATLSAHKLINPDTPDRLSIVFAVSAVSAPDKAVLEFARLTRFVAPVFVTTEVVDLAEPTPDSKSLELIVIYTHHSSTPFDIIVNDVLID